MDSGYWFKSALFEIEKNEDEETNPGCYGKSLAMWLSAEFSELGYNTEVIPEDWGWCVMCVYDEYLLWLGCGAMQSVESLENYEEGHHTQRGEVIWHVFPQIEVPFFNFRSQVKKWFGKLDLDTPLENLKNELGEILESEHSIQFLDEP